MPANSSGMVIKKHETASIAELAELFSKIGIQTFFTPAEIEHYFNGKTYQRLAARFLVKKLMLEQLELDDRFTEISIMNDAYGRPIPEFSGQTAQAFNDRQIAGISISLSHSRTMVTAFVVFEYLYAANSENGADFSDHKLGNQE